MTATRTPINTRRAGGHRPALPTPLRFTEAVGVERLLTAVPMRNDAVTVREHGDAAILSVPIARRWWARPPLTWVFPLRDHRRFALDALGREVWAAADGGHTVEQIVEAFARRHHLSFHEARLSVTAFLRTLTQRRLIVLWITPDANHDHDAAEAAA